MDVDSTGARWAQNDDNVVWCGSVEELVAALRAGHRDVEVGGVTQSGPLLQVIAEAAPHLQSLSVRACDLDAVALSQLAKALASSHITGIGVSNNPGLDMQHWVGFWEQLPRSIEKWDFGDDELPDEALPELMKVIARGSGIRELMLDGNYLTDLSPLLPAMPSSVGLIELDLGDNDIGDAQVHALAAVLPGSSVNTLVLGRNPLTDASAVPLVSVLPQTRIAALYLDSTLMGDATLDALVQVLPSTQLRELHIDETRVSDAGVLRLCSVLRASKIEHVDAEDNNLTEQTMAMLVAALPA